MIKIMLNNLNSYTMKASDLDAGECAFTLYHVPFTP